MRFQYATPVTGLAVLTHDILDAALLSTERARQVADIFGIHSGNASRRLLDQVKVPTAGITLVTGHSGSGKSTLLGRIAEMFPDARTLERHVPNDCAVIDYFPGDLASTIHWLGKFGLGEARVLLTRASVLSEGQKHRLLLARLLLDRPAVLLVDEFLSMLDRVTAKAIAHNFQKVCRESGLTAYVVTAHDDLVDALQPDAVVRLDLDGSSTTQERTHAVKPFAETALGAELQPDVGTIDDYRALSVFHYRDEDDPADAWGDLLREIRVVRFGGRVVAVKLFTRPFARALEALPLFRELNEKVLVQERTIVHPVFRGLALNRYMTPTAVGASKIVFSQSALGRYFQYNLKAGFARVPHPAESPDAAQAALRETVLGLAARFGAVNIQSSSQLEALFAKLAPADVAVVRSTARAAFTQVNARFVGFLADLAGRKLAPAEELQLQKLFALTFDRSAEANLPKLTESAMPFPMAAFVRSLP